MVTFLQGIPQVAAWKTWLATMGRNAAKPKGILRFNQYDQVIHAAMAGQGIALGRLELLTPHAVGTSARGPGHGRCRARQ